jgi:hypothetical protein
MSGSGINIVLPLSEIATEFDGTGSGLNCA